MPGVTAGQSTQCQPEPSQDTVGLKRADGVGRTTGMISAMIPQKRAEQVLIGPKKENQDIAHCPTSLLQCLKSDSRSWRLLLSCSPWRPSTTTSNPANSSLCNRKLSRTRRLIRLRSTARRACFFDIASPSRATPMSLERASVVKQESVDLTGCWKTRWNSDGVRSLAVRGKRADTVAGKALLSRCQPNPSLCSAGLDNLASISGCHARAETMRTDTLQITGLKCSFHDVVPVPRSTDIRQPFGCDYKSTPKKGHSVLPNRRFCQQHPKKISLDTLCKRR